MPVHRTLVKPTLAPGQVLNGVMVHRIFKEKPIYIRPLEQICDVSSFSMKRSAEENQEDDPVPQSPKVNFLCGLICIYAFLHFNTLGTSLPV